MSPALPDELLDRLVRVFGAARDPARAVPAAALDTWAAGPDPWLIRTAILHQLARGAGTDAERLFGYCTRQAGNRDFFVRKAIGWALRTHAGTDPESVRAYLQRNRAVLSPL